MKMGIIFSPWNSFAKFTQIIASLNFFGFEVSLVVFPCPQLANGFCKTKLCLEHNLLQKEDDDKKIKKNS